MKARIAKLESDVEYIKKDLGQLRIDMNTANGWFVRAVLAVAALAFSIARFVL